MRGRNKEGEPLGLSEYNRSSLPRQFRDCSYSRQESHLLMSGEHGAQGSSSEQRRAKQAAGCQRSTDVHPFTDTSLGSTREHAEVRMIQGKSISWQECPGSRLESSDRTLPLLPPPQAAAPSVEPPQKSRQEAFLDSLYFRVIPTPSAETDC